VKEAEEGGGIIVRVVNTGAGEVDTVLRFGVPIAGAWHSRLSEEKLAPAEREEGNGVRIQVPPRGIGTIRVEFQTGQGRG
jgi:hypothetical protein